jgi:protein-S-isoprenylcysteine O-methyltransferase Ste14
MVRDIGIAIAANGALLRAGMVIVGGLKSFLRRSRFKTVRLGPVELLAMPEPVALAVTAGLLLANRDDSGSAGGTIAAVAGAALVLLGLGLVAWSLLSWRGLFVGHAVLRDHELVTAGAYGWVRHPVYLAAVLVWAGLSLSFLSAIAAMATALYVVPVYLLYMRGEEQMMVESFGESYRRYREAVPALIPRRTRHAELSRQ